MYYFWKPLLIYLISYQDAQNQSLNLIRKFVWAKMQESCLITDKPLLS